MIKQQQQLVNCKNKILSQLFECLSLLNILKEID